MTREEFNSLTGLNVSEKEFDGINEMYLAAGEMDKATFCKEYKQHGKSQLVAELMETVREEKEDVNKLRKSWEKLFDERNQLVYFILEQSQELSSTALLKKAIEMAGHANVIRSKISSGMPLCELDLDYIRKNLPIN